MTSPTLIHDFWLANPQYWIPIGPKKQKEADLAVYNLIKPQEFDYTTQTPIGQIIYLDQFSRHFCRLGHLAEKVVEENRRTATRIFEYFFIPNKSGLWELSEIDLVFCLMPFKHLKKYDQLFEWLFNWVANTKKSLTQFPKLQKFCIDTMEKAFAEIENDPKCESFLGSIIYKSYSKRPVINFCIPRVRLQSTFDPKTVCDYYPDEYKDPDWVLKSTDYSFILENKEYYKMSYSLKQYYRNYPIISLSGGVDSMTMLFLANLSKIQICAVHIIYGNRHESEEEYTIVREFCKKLNVTLFVFRIPYLRRNNIDREFYETFTKRLRFWVYRTVGRVLPQAEPKSPSAIVRPESSPVVLLGHIIDDQIENIWTNIATGNNWSNLSKMTKSEEHLDVNICRPWLDIKKSDIFRVAEYYKIPYLKNTTPSWCNRGKFREHFHQATIDQYGPGVDDKIIEFARAFQKQVEILDVLVYKKIFATFAGDKINIATAIEIKLDPTGWMKIFEHFCHKYYHISRPSIKSVVNFTERILMIPKNKSEIIKIEMTKNLKVSVHGNFLTFIKK